MKQNILNFTLDELTELLVANNFKKFNNSDNIYGSELNGVKSVYNPQDEVVLCTYSSQYGMNVIMTSEDCPTHLERLYEVSVQVEADFYIKDAVIIIY